MHAIMLRLVLIRLTQPHVLMLPSCQVVLFIAGGRVVAAFSSLDQGRSTEGQTNRFNRCRNRNLRGG